MKYELDILESIIQNAIDSTQLSQNQFDVYDKTLYEECEHIKKVFIKKTFNIGKKKQIEVYIQNHQTCLIGLTNKVFQKLQQSRAKYICTEVNEFNLIDLQRRICDYLEDMLSFIETNFDIYFNHNAKIPVCCRVLDKKELTENVCRLITQLKYKFNCPLLKITFHPIIKYQTTYDSVSFRRFLYLKKLSRQINDSCLSCSGDTSHCKLKNKLIYLNFNSYRFFAFLSREIMNDYLKEDTIYGQIEKLCYHLKEFSQVQVHSDLSYKPERKSLNEQMVTWLIEEITYLEKRKELSCSVVQESQESIIKKDFKIVTGLSVSQVAFFLKLLVEVGAIMNNNQKELIRFVASCIKTRHTEHISPESLRTKYYNVDESTVDAVRDTIIKLLNETNNNK